MSQLDFAKNIQTLYILFHLYYQTKFTVSIPIHYKQNRFSLIQFFVSMKHHVLIQLFSLGKLQYFLMKTKIWILHYLKKFGRFFYRTANDVKYNYLKFNTKYLSARFEFIALKWTRWTHFQMHKRHVFIQYSIIYSIIIINSTL